MNAPVVEKDQPADNKVERLPVPAAQRRELIIVESDVAVLDTAKFDHMTRIAKLMAASSLVPSHLNVERKVGSEVVPIAPDEAIANCFLVVNQAVAWRMDPFAVAQHTFVHKGKIGYEGKLVASVLNTHPRLVKRLTYEYEGSGPKRKVKVSAKIAGDAADRIVEGTVEEWRTSNDNWTKGPDQMLSYRGAREWARRHMPEVILGVWSEDEIADFSATDRVQHVVTEQPQRGAAGLKAALNACAEIITGSTAGGAASAEFNAAATANSAALAGEKTVGTVEQRDAIVARLKGCSDQEILDLVRDEANATEWTKPDLDVINEAYRARKEDFGGVADA